MNKKEIEKQLQMVLSEAELLKEKSELDSETVDFLVKECDKLFSKVNNTDLDFEQKESLLKQMEALNQRLIRETQNIENDIPKMVDLENRLKMLSESSKEI